MSDDTYEMHGQTDAPLAHLPSQFDALDPESFVSTQIHRKCWRNGFSKNKYSGFQEKKNRKKRKTSNGRAEEAVDTLIVNSISMLTRK